MPLRQRLPGWVQDRSSSGVHFGLYADKQVIITVFPVSGCGWSRFRRRRSNALIAVAVPEVTDRSAATELGRRPAGTHGPAVSLRCRVGRGWCPAYRFE